MQPLSVFSNIINTFATIGKNTILTFAYIGQLIFFALHSIKHCFLPRFYFRQIGAQFLQVGFYSLPVVGLTAVFTGAVLALQSYTGFSRFNAEESIPSVVILSITRELGPVLTGLMVAGRVGASFAAEIGTMKVHDQIDALYTLSTNHYKFLVVPRLLVCLISMPILVLFADIIGVLGGYLVSVNVLDFVPQSYLQHSIDFVKMSDVTSGLIKSVFFGLIISILGCFNGFNSKNGAEGVGKATTNAVVSSSILILLTNYILTAALF